MGITPMEINNKEFKRSFRGYDIDEVDDFLELVVEDYEKLYKENTALREKINSLTERLEHYTKIEETLQNTLILAQGAADQTKANAQKEAELIVKNSNDTAQKIIDQAHTEVVRITSEYERIKQEFQVFKSKYKNFIQTQLDLLSDIDTLTNDSKVFTSSDLQSRNAEISKRMSEISKISEANKNEPVSNDKKSSDESKVVDFSIKSSDQKQIAAVNFDDFEDADTNR